MERDEKGRWMKGHSGNQKGMPKRLTAIRDLARQYTQEAIETLVQIMRDETKEASCRVRAAQELLDRPGASPSNPSTTKAKRSAWCCTWAGSRID